MDIRVDRIEAIVVVTPDGRLDAINGPALDSAVEDVLRGGDTSLVIDMGSIPYISSAGLGVLLKSAKRAKDQGGRIALASLQDPVTHVFSISGFHNLFVVYEHSTAAVAALRQESSEGPAC